MLEMNHDTANENAADPSRETLKDIPTQSGYLDYGPVLDAWQQIRQQQYENSQKRRAQDLQNQQRQRDFARQQANTMLEINRLDQVLGISPQETQRQRNDLQNLFTNTYNNAYMDAYRIMYGGYMYGFTGSFMSGTASTQGYIERNPVPEFKFDMQTPEAPKASDTTVSSAYTEFLIAQKQVEAFQNDLNNLTGFFETGKPSNDLQPKNLPTNDFSPYNPQTTEIQQQFQDTMNQFFQLMNQYFGQGTNDQGLKDTSRQGTKDTGVIKQPERIRDIAGVDDKAAEALDMIFTKEVLDSWDYLSIQEKAERVGAYATQLNKAMGISINNIEIKPLLDNVFGAMFATEHRMEINYKALENKANLGILLDTITHEARHQLQYEAVVNPERFPYVSHETIEAWRNNRNNYISMNDSPEGYFKQPIEVDARKFAEDVLKKSNLNIQVVRQLF